jgi:LPS sulfotransferase NodH
VHPHALGYSGLASTTTVDGNPRVYYQAPDRSIWELAWMGDKWAAFGASASVGARADLGSSLASTRTVDGNPRVYYRAKDQTIWELAWMGNKWAAFGASASVGAPLASNTCVLTSKTFEGNPRVYYISQQGGHVIELAWGRNSWHYRDLAAELGAPLAIGGLASTTTVEGNPRVYYQAPDQSIWELAWMGDKWAAFGASASVGAPTAAKYSALTAITLRGEPRVYYLADDRRVHELAWWDKHWHWAALEVPPPVVPKILSFTETVLPPPNDPKARLAWRVEAGPSCNIKIIGGVNFDNLAPAGYKDVERGCQAGGNWYEYTLSVQCGQNQVQKTIAVPPFCPDNPSPSLQSYYFKATNCPSTVTPCFVFSLSASGEEQAKQLAKQNAGDCTVTKISEEQYYHNPCAQ